MKHTFFLLLTCLFLLLINTETALAGKKEMLFGDFASLEPEEVLASMSLEEKLGQVFIFGFGGTGLNDEYRAWLLDGKLGNIKLFLRNIESREQLRELTDSIVFLIDNSATGIPPFIATDMEGGTVNHVRYEGVFLSPAAGLIGASGKVENNRNASRLIAYTLLDAGINVNFAPCADVLTEPRNRVIGTRSFGSDPEMVTAMTASFVEEHQRLGILSVVKHFPGHGMASFDTHLHTEAVKTSMQEIIDVHLRPYGGLVRKEVLDGIMVSHVIYDHADPSMPASFSSKILESGLREKMGFRGVVVTDDLEMEGSEGFAGHIVTAFVYAFRAGNDLFLISHTKEKQELLIDRASLLFERGTLDERALDEKVLRILEVKKKYLVPFYTIRERESDMGPVLEKLSHQVAEDASDGLVLMASTLECTVPEYLESALGRGVRGVVLSPTRDFEETARRYFPGWDTVYIRYFPNRRSNFRKIESMRKDLASYDIALLGLANERQTAWARSCIREGVPLGVLSIDNPYYARTLREDALFIACCFGPHSPALDALFESVCRTGLFPGLLPYDYDLGLDEVR